MGQILERRSRKNKLFALEQLLQTFETFLELFSNHSKMF